MIICSVELCLILMISRYCVLLINIILSGRSLERAAQVNQVMPNYLDRSLSKGIYHNCSHPIRLWMSMTGQAFEL
jgi:hypothetical protein